jgi:inhibitor of cysteine peptidase
MPDPLRLGKSDSGRAIAVAKSQSIVIELPENPSTGYVWILSSVGSFKTVADTFLPAGGSVGATGKHVFELRCDAAGQFDLVMVHQRSWETADKALEKFSLKVDVR